MFQTRKSGSEIKHTLRHTAQLRSSIYFSSLHGLQLMSSVVCHVICINLGPKSAISRGEQNRYGWRRRILLTAQLINFYGGLRLMKSTAAYGGLWRRLGALRPSHGWISWKRLKSGWCNFHHTVAPSLSSRNSDGILPSGGVKQRWFEETS